MFFRLQRSQKTIRLDSGSLRFIVPIDDGATAIWDADLIVLKLNFESIETRHRLSLRPDGAFETSQQFLDDVSDALIKAGCPRANATLARQVWIAVNDCFVKTESRFRKDLKKAIG